MTITRRCTAEVEGAPEEEEPGSSEQIPSTAAGTQRGTQRGTRRGARRGARHSALLTFTVLITAVLALATAATASATAAPAASTSPPTSSSQPPKLERSGHTKHAFPQEIMKAGDKRLKLAKNLLDAARSQAAKDRARGADTAALDLIVDLEGAPADLEAALLVEAQAQGAAADVTPATATSATTALGDATFPVTVDGVFATAGELTLDLGLLTAGDRAWFIDILGRAYPVMVDVYGPPAAPLTVRVWKSAYLPYQGLYAPQGNLLLVRGLDADVAIHELLHAFRDDAMSAVPAYEEGIVRAAEVTILDRLGIASWDSGFSYIYDRAYDAHNTDTLLGSTGTFLAGYGPMYLLRYQTAGMAWAQAEIARPGLLRDFNTGYVAAVLAEPTLRGDAAYQTSLLASLTGEVEGRSLAEWAPLQRPLAPSGGTGVQLHSDVTADVLTIRLYTRNEYGLEAAAPGAVTVEVSDPSADPTVRTLSLSTNSIGMASADLSTPTPRRLDLRLAANTPSGTAERTIQTYGGVGRGIFGIVPGAAHPATGTVAARITAADGRDSLFTAAIGDHAFQIPELSDYLGVVALTVTFEGDSATWEQVVVKGRGDTYVVLGDLRQVIVMPPVADTTAPLLSLGYVAERIMPRLGPATLGDYTADEPVAVTALLRHSGVPATPIRTKGSVGTAESLTHHATQAPITLTSIAGRISWDGRTSTGAAALPGLYTVEIWAEDEAGNRSTSVMVTVTLTASTDRMR